MIKSRLTSFTVNGEEIIQHLGAYPEITPEPLYVGFDPAAGDDHTVYVRFTRSEKAWDTIDVCRWLGVSYWLMTGKLTKAQRRRATKRFIREEVARRRLERFGLENADRASAGSVALQ